MKSIYKLCVPVITAVFMVAAVSAIAQPSMAVKEDQAQMKSDKAALLHALARLEVDETKLKADKASGKMAAESKESAQVY